MAVIPPDPAAVRQAMQPPPRPPANRLALIIGGLAGLALIGSFLIPDGGDRPAADPGPDAESKRYVDTYNHPVGFRFLVPLAPGRTGKRDELETMLAFGYSVYRPHTQRARDAIKANWHAASQAVAAVIRRHTKLELVSDLESVNDEVREALDETLFPDRIAQVQTVRWNELRFR